MSKQQNYFSLTNYIISPCPPSFFNATNKQQRITIQKCGQTKIRKKEKKKDKEEEDQI